MDRTEIVHALRQAQVVVVSHGIVNHIPERYKATMLSEPNELTDSLQYDFYLDPKKSMWETTNFSCSLVIAYCRDNDYELNGGIYRNYARKITIRHGTGEVDLPAYKKREDFVASLLMLAEIVEAITPATINITVETPDQVLKRKRREVEQEIGGRIHSALDKKDLKNLRKGGNSRTIRFPESPYKTNYGVLPEVGSYAYKHVIHKNRNGRIVNFANYIFRVMDAPDGGFYLKIFKLT